MQMTDASTKAVAPLTPCLRPSSFGAPATIVSRGRFARQSAHCGVIFARRRESEWSAQGDPNSHCGKSAAHIAYGSALSAPFVIYNKGTAALPPVLLCGPEACIPLAMKPTRVTTSSPYIPIARHHPRSQRCNARATEILATPYPYVKQQLTKKSSLIVITRNSAWFNENAFYRTRLVEGKEEKKRERHNFPRWTVRFVSSGDEDDNDDEDEDRDEDEDEKRRFSSERRERRYYLDPFSLTHFNGVVDFFLVLLGKEW
ncbi:hypothetical protein EAG_02873 [Camponotus floridanus]|uniref:Uncharacterized protein n=1 Tax=Camponotus floridanus TaxID=104421 RepID=E2AGF3_CAMFO|nr:hypothetical protein EAG_02873 [Camponotus floridanus]